MEASTHHRYPRGSVLVYVSLLVMTMSTVAFAATALLVREIDIVRTADDGLTAVTASNSGAERALYYLRVALQGGESLDETALARVADLSGSVGDGTYVVETATDSVESASIVFESTDIARQDFQLFMVDSQNSFDPRPSGTPLPRSARLLWNEDDSCTPGTSHIVLNYVDLTQIDAPESATDAAAQTIVGCLRSETGPYGCSALVNTPLSPHQFLVRLRPLPSTCALRNEEIQFYAEENANGDVIPIPFMPKVAVIGDGRQTRRRLTITTQWLPTASTFSTFVVYSVETIAK